MSENKTSWSKGSWWEIMKERGVAPDYLKNGVDSDRFL